MTEARFNFLSKRVNAAKDEARSIFDSNLKQ